MVTHQVVNEHLGKEMVVGNIFQKANGKYIFQSFSQIGSSRKSNSLENVIKRIKRIFPNGKIIPA